MCGRYVSPDEAAIERLYRIDRRSPHPLITNFNVAPTTGVPVIVEAADGATELTEARWGLIPSWWSKPKPPTLTFNARSEEAAAKPMWRQPYRHCRCLMPALGWFEWQEPGSVDPETGEIRAVKRPFFIQALDEGTIAFAGLLSRYRTAAGAEQLSCALLSRAAAPNIASIHDRMPVVLPSSSFGAWLDPALTEAAAVAKLVESARTDFAGYPVSNLVNNARNNSERVLLRAD